MPQFDVYRTRSGDLLIDCQTNVLAHLNTRFVVPLLPLEPALCGPPRLNPQFRVDGTIHVMVTEFAATVPARELARQVTSLADDYITIENAIDYLLNGY